LTWWQGCDIPGDMTWMEDDMPPLSEPDLVSCLVIEEVQPHMLAMRLHWPDDDTTGPQIWDLPGNVQQFGPAPDVFGIVLHRMAFDGFDLRLWWDGTHFSWPHLSRRTIEDSCLGRLLSALGSDLGFMLDQPVRGEPQPVEKAA
jgi:hypothetical protein